MRNNKGHSQQGFTLLELIVVMTLIGLMVGIVGVNLGMRLPKEKLKATVRDVVSTLRYAKNRAQTKAEQVVVRVDLDNRYIEAFNKKKTIPEGIEISVFDPEQGWINQGAYKITFFPGYGCSGGEMMLKAKNMVYSIKVSPLTGSTHVRKIE